MTLEQRSATTKHDFQRAFELEQATFGQIAYTPEEFEWIANHGLVIVLTDPQRGGLIVAISSLIFEASEWYLHLHQGEAYFAGNSVLPDYRGGVGQQLALAQEEAARQAGFSTGVTTVRPNNHVNLSLRFKLGWQVFGAERSNYADPAGNPSGASDDTTGAAGNRLVLKRNLRVPNHDLRITANTYAGLQKQDDILVPCVLDSFNVVRELSYQGMQGNYLLLGHQKTDTPSIVFQQP